MYQSDNMLDVVVMEEIKETTTNMMVRERKKE